MKLISKIKDKCIKLLGGHTENELEEAYNSRTVVIDRSESVTLEAKMYLDIFSGRPVPPEEYIKRELASKVANTLTNSEFVEYQYVESLKEPDYICICARIKVLPIHSMDDSCGAVLRRELMKAKYMQERMRW